MKEIVPAGVVPCPNCGAYVSGDADKACWSCGVEFKHRPAAKRKVRKQKGGK